MTIAIYLPTQLEAEEEEAEGNKVRSRDELYADLASQVDKFIKAGDSRKVLIAVDELSDTISRLQRLRENIGAEQRRKVDGMRLATDIRQYISMHCYEKQLKQLGAIAEAMESSST
jgi:hypothetical protein